MPIEFRCPQCSKLLRVADETAGKQAKCPACGTVQVIPAAVPSPEQPSRAPREANPFAALPASASSDNPYASPMAAPMPPAGAYFDRMSASRRDGPPWERDGASFRSFLETTKSLYAGTNVFFSEMRREGGLGAPLLYGLLGGTVGSLTALAFQVGMQTLAMGFGGANGANGPPIGIFLGIMIAFGLIGIPIGMLINMFLFSGIFHLMLLMIGAARQPFEATFRVVAYSLGSSSLLGLIPICGQMISGIVNLVFVCIGLTYTHEISGWKATVAVLLPIFICCGAAIAIYAVAIAAVVAGAR